jgi:hypothetical protein
MNDDIEASNVTPSGLGQKIGIWFYINDIPSGLKASVFQLVRLYFMMPSPKG